MYSCATPIIRDARQAIGLVGDSENKEVWSCDFLQITDLFFRPIFACFINVSMIRRRLVVIQPTRAFDALVFDLGGVLIELAGVARMLELLEHRLSVDELWAHWLASETVRQFESGRIGAQQFATAVCREFNLAIPADAFLLEFTAWPQGLYPGAIELLQDLASTYTLACLTNTNAAHWPRISDEMVLLPHFAMHFASHQLGLLKPDPAIFHYVITQLSLDPARILFLDDNQVNVDSARSVGMTAYRVVGLEGVKQQLVALKIWPVSASA